MLTPLLKYKYVRLVMVRLHYQSSDIASINFNCYIFI
nr:MAG TPA: hypothetical protein [Caudoviricetes sp.]DAF07296.1 MAG TPA: hypothetical protein [Caudoviricetes sp.]